MDNINENAVETKVEDSVVEETIKCGKCGAQLEENQLFCPMCGAKRKKPKKEEAKAENEKKPASKKKKVVLFVVLGIVSLALLVTGVVASVAYTNKMDEKYEAVVKAMQAYMVDVTAIEGAYQDLTPKGQERYKDELIDVLYDMVLQNQYSDDEWNLVDDSIGRKADYIVYQQITEIIDMDTEKGEKLKLYIDIANELYSYSNENSWYGAIVSSKGDYALFTQEMKKAEIVPTAQEAIWYLESALNYLGCCYGGGFGSDLEKHFSALESEIRDLTSSLRGFTDEDEVDDEVIYESMQGIEEYIELAGEYEEIVNEIRSKLPEL